MGATSADSWVGRLPKRGLVVGQAPPGAPEDLAPDYLPLQGQPERRLAKLAGLARPEELWACFDRLDLIGWCPGPKDRKSYHLLSTGYSKHNRDGHRFPLKDAKLAASRLLKFGELAHKYAVVVLCGRHVATAFGLRHFSRNVPWAEELNGIRFLVLPHPSGVSHFWNDEVSWHRAAGTFRAALKAVQLGQPVPLTPTGCREPRSSVPLTPTGCQEPRSSASAPEQPRPSGVKRRRAAEAVDAATEEGSEASAPAPPGVLGTAVVRSRFFPAGIAHCKS
ncbi:unnamed protein product [Polarella glacialis]|uniref:Uracil-DNA glycosylase-like domain-containing protein n=1 Tax=Polarella glacialis TaxID=89957 RepID=A0A813GD71_POLGL|nr:unnamed protein product [Polarella glacialis]